MWAGQKSGAGALGALRASGGPEAGERQMGEPGGVGREPAEPGGAGRAPVEAEAQVGELAPAPAGTAPGLPARAGPARAGPGPSGLEGLCPATAPRSPVRPVPGPPVGPPWPRRAAPALPAELGVALDQPAGFAGCGWPHPRGGAVRCESPRDLEVSGSCRSHRRARPRGLRSRRPGRVGVPCREASQVCWVVREDQAASETYRCHHHEPEPAPSVTARHRWRLTRWLDGRRDQGGSSG